MNVDLLIKIREKFEPDYFDGLLAPYTFEKKENDLKRLKNDGKKHFEYMLTINTLTIEDEIRLYWLNVETNFLDNIRQLASTPECDRKSGKRIYKDVL